MKIREINQIMFLPFRTEHPPARPRSTSVVLPTSLGPTEVWHRTERHLRARTGPHRHLLQLPKCTNFQ